MKINKFSVLVILAMVLALSLAFTGCDPNGDDEPYEGPKSIKITGITLTEDDTDGRAGIVICKEYTNEGNLGNAGVIIAREGPNLGITNGELFFDLLVSNGWDATNEPWNGSGEYAICLQITGTDGWDDDGGHHHRYWWTKDGEYAKYNIKDAVTTLEFSQFEMEW
jgi:hypothetical protein